LVDVSIGRGKFKVISVSAFTEAAGCGVLSTGSEWSCTDSLSISIDCTPMNGIINARSESAVARQRARSFRGMPARLFNRKVHHRRFDPNVTSSSLRSATLANTFSSAVTAAWLLLDGAAAGCGQTSVTSGIKAIGFRLTVGVSDASTSGTGGFGLG
jgi:hypothetical protein